MANGMFQFHRGRGFRTRASRENGGLGLESAGRQARACASARRSTRVERRAWRPRGRYPPRRRAGLTVSWCDRRALRQIGRTATEARVRSPSMESAVHAEPERKIGIRTRALMIHSHLLYQLSYPRSGRGCFPNNGPSSFQRNTKPQSGPRQPGLDEPVHKAEAKVRAYDRNGTLAQEAGAGSEQITMKCRRTRRRTHENDGRAFAD
jgi:hypothetical protein